MLRRAALLATACLALACKDPAEPAIIVTDGIAGTYTLRTVNGFALPQVVYTNLDTTLSILGGAVIIHPDSTFTDSTLVEYVYQGGFHTQSDVAKGFIITFGDSVGFFANVGVAYSMHRDDNTLTQAFEGDLLVYRK